ncbi:MAG: hypothetical protein PUC12_10055 [Clostridiales bacterium]|nr:hypothetical protein [Clostridiales bacterium]
MNYKDYSDMKRCNGAALFAYGFMNVTLIICYIIEVLKKSRTISYLLIFSLLALVPFFVCLFSYRKDYDTPIVKRCMPVGFWIFYTFIIFTTISPVAYVYAIVVGTVLFCYNDAKLLIRFTGAILLSNVGQVIYTGITHQIASEDLPNIEIRIGSLILFTLYSIASSHVMEANPMHVCRQLKRKRNMQQS